MKIRNNIGMATIIVGMLLAAGCYTTLEKSLDKEKVILSAPVNNLVTTDTAISFYWDPVESATSYQLQIASPRFDSIARFITDTTITNNLFKYILYSGDYQWRVKAINSGSATDYSAPGNLTIQ